MAASPVTQTSRWNYTKQQLLQASLIRNRALAYQCDLNGSLGHTGPSLSFSKDVQDHQCHLQLTSPLGP